MKHRACWVCGAYARTSVAWPPMRVREHFRCDDCWRSWEMFCQFFAWWYGPPANLKKRAL